MKILTLSNCPLKEHQGSGYVIINYCQGMRSKGHEVDLFGPEHFEPMKILRKAKSHRQAIGMLFLALKQLARKRYDVIELYGSEACLAAWTLSLLPRRSFLMVAHSNGVETHVHEQLKRHLGSYAPDGRPLRWYQSTRSLPIAKAFTKVDAIVTVSEFDRAYAVKHHYQAEARIAAIDNPLPDDFLNQPVSYEREKTIGYCGSWLPRKGSMLVESDMPRILADFPDYRFKLIGVGQAFRKEDHFPPALLSRIDVIPFIEDKRQLRDLYQSLAILVVPSVYESFGLVTAEGMACGCAVAATKTGFANSLKEGEEAILFDMAAAAGLYDAVKKLILDDSLRRHVAQAGYGRVQNLRWPAAVDRLESLYQTWLAEIRRY